MEWNIEERTRTQVYLHPPHEHTPNSIPLDSRSISKDSTTPLGSLCVHRPCQRYTHNPTGLPVLSQGCTYTPNGLLVHSQGCTCTPTPNQDAPHNLSPPFQVLCFYSIYLTRDNTAQRVCSPGAGFNPPEFVSPCGLPVSCCLATSVVRSRRGPRGLPSLRIFMVLGGMKAAFVPSPFPVQDDSSSCTCSQNTRVGPKAILSLQIQVYRTLFGERAMYQNTRADSLKSLNNVYKRTLVLKVRAF